MRGRARVMSAAEAVGLIPSGVTIALSGFGGYFFNKLSIRFDIFDIDQNRIWRMSTPVVLAPFSSRSLVTWYWLPAMDM